MIIHSDDARVPQLICLAEDEPVQVVLNCASRSSLAIGDPSRSF
jgi:hypothetical protein